MFNEKKNQGDKQILASPVRKNAGLQKKVKKKYLLEFFWGDEKNFTSR